MPEVKRSGKRKADADIGASSIIDRIFNRIQPVSSTLVVPNMSLRYLGKLQTFPRSEVTRDKLERV